jgi:hypothetical protein
VGKIDEGEEVDVEEVEEVEEEGVQGDDEGDLVWADILLAFCHEIYLIYISNSPRRGFHRVLKF